VHGGMATVYLGHDSELERPVAVKVLAESLGGARPSGDGSSARPARLSHPNVVGVYDAGEEADGPYIVMEYVEGRTLAELLGERVGYPPTRRSPSGSKPSLAPRPTSPRSRPSART